jgi:hypothetical protein
MRAWLVRYCWMNESPQLPCAISAFLSIRTSALSLCAVADRSRCSELLTRSADSSSATASLVLARHLYAASRLRVLSPGCDWDWDWDWDLDWGFDCDCCPRPRPAVSGGAASSCCAVRQAAGSALVPVISRGRCFDALRETTWLGTAGVLSFEEGAMTGDMVPAL